MTVDMSSSPRSARGLVFVPHPRAAGGLCSVTAATCTSDTSVERELLSGLVAVPQCGCQLRTFCVAAGTHQFLFPRLGAGHAGQSQVRAGDARDRQGPRHGVDMHICIPGWTRRAAGAGRARKRTDPSSSHVPAGARAGARSLAFPAEGFPPALGRGAVFVPPSLAVCPLPRGFPHQGTGWTSPLLHSPGPTPGVCAGPGVTGAPACRGHVHTEPSPALNAAAASLYPSGLRV